MTGYQTEGWPAVISPPRTNEAPKTRDEEPKTSDGLPLALSDASLSASL